MKIKYFKKGLAYKNGRELNIQIGKLQLRLASHQFALWNEYNPIFNFLF